MKRLSKKAREELLEILEEYHSTEEDLVELNREEDLIFSDEWLDGSDSREELVYLKKQLLKAQGKKIQTLSVYDVESLTGNRQHRGLFLRRKKNIRAFRPDRGNVWIIKFE